MIFFKENKDLRLKTHCERCLFPLPSGHDMQTVVNLIIDKNYNINVFIYCWLLLSLLLTGACRLVASDLYVTFFVSYVR